MKNNHYERAGTLSIEEVFEEIKNHLKFTGRKRVKIKDFLVNVQSLRLRTFFHTGTNCPCCENKASFFAAERTPGNKHYHLNLYGINKDKEEVIFTHDHTLARSLGGSDDLSNTQTMCGPCNWEKGKVENILRQEQLASISILEKVSNPEQIIASKLKNNL